MRFKESGIIRGAVEEVYKTPFRLLGKIGINKYNQIKKELITALRRRKKRRKKMKIVLFTVFHIVLINAQCGIRWRGRCGRTVSKSTPPDLHYLDSEDENKTINSWNTWKRNLSFKEICASNEMLPLLREICEEVIIKNTNFSSDFGINKICRQKIPR